MGLRLMAISQDGGFRIRKVGQISRLHESVIFATAVRASSPWVAYGTAKHFEDRCDMTQTVVCMHPSRSPGDNWVRFACITANRYSDFKLRTVFLWPSELLNLHPGIAR